MSSRTYWKVDASSLALLALVALVGFGLHSRPIPGGKQNPEDPEITVERRVRPWREISRFLQTHGERSLIDLQTFREAWNAEYGERPLTIETLGRSGHHKLNIRITDNIMDTGTDERPGMPASYMRELFSALKQFLQSDYRRNPASEGWRSPSSGDLFSGAEDTAKGTFTDSDARSGFPAQSNMAKTLRTSAAGVSREAN